MTKRARTSGWWQWRGLLALGGIVLLAQGLKGLIALTFGGGDSPIGSMVRLAMALAMACVGVGLWCGWVVRSASAHNPNQGPFLGRLEFGFKAALVHLVPGPAGEAWFRWGFRAHYRDQALACFERAASLGHADAHFELGLFQEQGEWGAGGRMAAFQHYLAAAKLGHGEAAFRLAEGLRWGMGPGPDPKGALRWYLQSAKRGFGPAMGWLAHAYEAGDGVEPDPGHAAHWKAQVEAQGLGVGLRESSLARPGWEGPDPLVRLGHGVRMALVDSFQAMGTAPGFETAAKGAVRFGQIAVPAAILAIILFLFFSSGPLGAMFAIITLAPFIVLIPLALSFRKGSRQSYHGRRLETAARKGDPEACHRLGMILVRGNHDHPEDAVAARSWLLKAAQAGHVGAMKGLGEMLSWGVGGLPNPVEGRAWLERAAASSLRIAPAKAPDPAQVPHTE